MMMLFLFLKEEGGRRGKNLLLFFKGKREVERVVVLLNLELNFTLKW